MAIYYIYGASGHGKVVLQTFNTCNKITTAFIDDNADRSFCGLPVLSPSNFQDSFPSDCFSIHFAIGNNQIRHYLQKKWEKRGIMAETIVHPSSTCYSSSKINNGSLIAAGSIIGPDCTIGYGCIVNHNAVVDHDCIIGNFCHIGPSSTLGGAVTLGDQCFVGAGTVILPSLNIGNNVTIGAGAVVIHDIPNDVTVVGCPAQPINTTN